MTALKTVLVKGTLLVGFCAATLAGSVSQTYADQAGAIAAGVIGGAALGALAGSAVAGAYGPPPVYVAPAYVPPPCRRVFIRVWDPYIGAYVDRPRRVCY